MYKVCFADDEPIIFKVLNALVNWSDIGFQIAGTATDGIEALALYEREKPDLFIIDIKMPLMDGLSCIKRLRERDHRLKIVLLTASDSFESAQEALNLGANGYLLKPVSRESINKIVAKITAELSQTAPPTHMSVSNNNANAFIFQRELQRLYVSSINYDNDFSWLKQSKLAENNCILLDLTVHSVCRQEPDGIAAFLEQLPISLASMGVDLPAHYITANARAVYAVASTEEKLISSLEQYFAGLVHKYRHSIYILKNLRHEECLSNLYGSIQANRNHSFYNSSNWIGSFIFPDTTTPCDLPFNSIKTIVASALQDLNIDTLSIFLQDVFTLAKSTLYSPRQLQGFCYNVLIQLKVNMKELGLQQSADELDKIEIESFLSTESSDELFSYIMHLFRQQLEKLAIREDFSRNKSIVLKANTYAKENYSDPQLSLESAAEYVGLSKNYFIRLYGRETGSSFWTYITKLRIEQAKLLLSSSQLSMIDICTQIGYDDVSYFSRKFKLETGLSPRKYRHLHQNSIKA